MSIPRSVAEILSEHVTLELEGIDRMYLSVYVPRLQREAGVAGFFRFHRGHRFASSVLMDPISKAFVQKLEAFATQHAIPVVAFRKGERKDEVAATASLRKRFLGEHPGSWAGPFTADVRAGAQSGFYRELAALTNRFVTMEAAKIS
jgi:hypothetical protein